MSNISIFGLGYVGCVAAGCLARAGHTVIGVDSQKTKVAFINRGQPTIIEPGIDEVIAAEHAAGRLSATTDSAAAIQKTDISFICVGTPSTNNGHLELGAIFNVAEEIGRALKQKSGRHVVAIRSTVLPGTNERLTAILAEKSGKTPGQDFAVVSNPEFLREATAIEDFQHPSFTLIGASSDWAAEQLREVYARVDAPFIVAAPRVAEMMKYVCNSFHALKITFANEVGNICKSMAIDSHEVMRIFCQDTKLNISKAYLKPGFAYGGSCLPKDLKALQTIAHDSYLNCPVLENIERSNDQQKSLVFRQIQSFGKERIGFIGISFKSGTDDLRESPILDVIERLLGKGASIRIYDKHVHLSQLTGANRDYILQKIPYISKFITNDLASVLEHSELIVVVNNEPGLKEALAPLLGSKQIFDLTRIGLAPASGGNYSGLAW